MVPVAAQVPRDWVVVTRDLYTDFGAVTFDGVAFTPMTGDGAGLFDHMYLGRTVADEFLEPTRIYVRAVRSVLNHYRVKNVIHAIAHITGGGLHENLARVLPEGVRIAIDRRAWPVLPVFTWLQRLGGVEQAEMDQVFNMGIGMVLVVPAAKFKKAQTILERAGEKCFTIGRIVNGERKVIYA